MTSRTGGGGAAAGSKRSHSAISTSGLLSTVSSRSASTSLSLSSLGALSPPPSPPSPSATTAAEGYTRSGQSLRAVQSSIPYLYDLWYELSLDWPLYSMAWGRPLSSSSPSFQSLSASDRESYMMQRLYYAQSTDATFDPYSGRFVGSPHLLVQAEMPLPLRPCLPDMRAAASGQPRILEDVCT